MTSGVDRDGELLNKDRLKRKLRPLYWWLYDVRPWARSRRSAAPRACRS